MIKLNPETMEIICPSGDTGLLLIRLADGDGQPLPPLNGVAVFAVCQKTKNSYNMTSSKIVEIVDNTATIHITNQFSRIITPGDYLWDVRIVTDPDYDDDGNVRCDDDTDEVHSLFAGRKDDMPKFTVPGVAVDV